MNIITKLRESQGNSIVNILRNMSNPKIEIKTHNKFTPLGENALISDLGGGITSIGECWTMEELDNGDLVFYYKGSERYRIEI